MAKTKLLHNERKVHYGTGGLKLYLQYKLIYQNTCYVQRMNADVVKTSPAVGATITVLSGQGGEGGVGGEVSPM